MDRSTAPFEVGDEVVCVDDTPNEDWGKLLQRDNIYTVVAISPANTGCIMVSGVSIYYWDPERFRKINPYQSSVSRSLAERAVESIGDGQDLKPVKVKEVLQ